MADPAALPRHPQFGLVFNRPGGQGLPTASSAAGGPGTELEALLAGYGVAKQAGCGCSDKARLMDLWGVEGCRARRDEIVGWLKEAGAERGWLAGTAASMFAGLLVDQAIAAAERKRVAAQSVVPAGVPAVVPQSAPVRPAPAALLVIGHFGMPGVVNLQLALAKAYLPGVTVVVSDDHTEQAYNGVGGETAAHGRARYERLQAICERYDALLVPSHPTVRCRHAGGDLAAMWNGLTIARDRGIPFVWKLSMRFLVDRPNWLGEAVAAWERAVADTGYLLPLASHECYHTGLPPSQADLRFPVRTECVGFRVSDWLADEFLHPESGLLRPRDLGGRTATEHVIGEALARRGGGMFGPAFFTAYRQQPHPWLWWHDADPAEKAVALAAKYGVDLGPEFHAGGSPQTVGYVGA